MNSARIFGAFAMLYFGSIGATLYSPYFVLAYFTNQRYWLIQARRSKNIECVIIVSGKGIRSLRVAYSKSGKIHTQQNAF